MEIVKWIRQNGVKVALCLGVTVAAGQSAWAVAAGNKTMLILNSQETIPFTTCRDSVLESLAKAGYVDGKNLKVKQVNIQNDIAKGEEELKASMDYDVIVVNGTSATLAAKKVGWGNDKKFVFIVVTDPVKAAGVIEDFKNPPKSNFTGVSYPVPIAARMRFIKQLMPKVKNIGLPYADIAQSYSYKEWIENVLATDPEYKDIKVHFRKMPSIAGVDFEEYGKKNLVPIVKELDKKVDVWLANNDPYCTSPTYSKILSANSKKPIIGLGLESVMKQEGATMVIYPDQVATGRQAARMIAGMFEGKAVKDFVPETPSENGFAFDLTKTKKFKISVPVEMIEAAGSNIIK